MKPIFTTKENIEQLDLSEKEKKELLQNPVLGFSCKRVLDYGKPVNLEEEGFTLAGAAQEILDIAPECCLKQSPIKIGDYIVSFNGARVAILKGERVFVKNGKIYQDYAQIAFENETVKIKYLTPKPRRRGMFDHEESNVEEKETEVTIKFLHSITDENQIKQVEKQNILSLTKKIKNKIFNQDKAIDKIFKSIKIFMAGLKDPSKPIGGFLFVGPTGVGKTEVAKLYAQELGFNFVRIDMSEYSHDHNVSRLIGSPPSYVGYGDKTVLEQEIGSEGRKTVLLLDEMEKAHPELQKIFLQVLDNAKLTLGNNKEVNFSNTLILMTSNLGVITKSTIGLQNNEDKILTVNMDTIKQHFLPEFIGRLSGVVEFNALTNNQAEQILNKFVKEFNETHLSKKGIAIFLSEKATKYLVEKGFDSKYGARPMKQCLANEVFEKVADLLLFDEVKADILIDYNGLEIVAKVKNLREKKSEKIWNIGFKS